MLVLVSSSQNPNFPVMFFRANLHPQISLENWDFGWFLDSGIFQNFLNFSHRFPENSPIFAKNWDFLSRILRADSFHSFVTSPQVLGNWSVEKGVVLRVSAQIFGVFRVIFHGGMAASAGISPWDWCGLSSGEPQWWNTIDIYRWLVNSNGWLIVKKNSYQLMMVS